MFKTSEEIEEVIQFAKKWMTLKKIEGKTYYPITATPNKKHAQVLAKNIRDAGYNVRVIYEPEYCTNTIWARKKKSGFLARINRPNLRKRL